LGGKNRWGTVMIRWVAHRMAEERKVTLEEGCTLKGERMVEPGEGSKGSAVGKGGLVKSFWSRTRLTGGRGQVKKGSETPLGS